MEGDEIHEYLSEFKTLTSSDYAKSGLNYIGKILFVLWLCSELRKQNNSNEDRNTSQNQINVNLEPDKFLSSANMIEQWVMPYSTIVIKSLK